MIDEGRVSQVLGEICDTVKHKRSSMGFMARCPVCGDSQKHKRMGRLHVDYYSQYDDWIAKCYNGGCDISGSTNLTSLYSRVKGITYTEARKYIDNGGGYDIQSIKDRLMGKSTPVVEQKKEQFFDLDMKHCLSRHDEPTDRVLIRCKKYLDDFITRRMIPDDKECFIAFDGRYKGRIIIPIIINGEMVYFQGRTVVGAEPKYLNPVVDKSLIISNIDRFDKDKSIIITEGLIDSWMAGNQGTACIGAYISDEFVDLVSKHTNKDVIICFDNPLIDKSGKNELIKFINESAYSKKVKYFLPKRTDFKDLNDLKLLGVDDIYQYVLSHSHQSFNVIVNLKYQNCYK